MGVCVILPLLLGVLDCEARWAGRGSAGEVSREESVRFEG